MQFMFKGPTSLLSALSVAAVLSACSSTGAVSPELAEPGATGGAASYTGGSSGEPDAAGGADVGSSSGGTNSEAATEPTYRTGFTDLNGWHQAAKSNLMPGATATSAAEPGTADGSALRLFVAGDAALSADDFAGPGAHAIELVKDGGAQLFGRYEFDVQFARCESGEELVSGLFTYFNDGSDADGDGIADNSEIDIEQLCGTPQYLFFTVWTDYQENPSTSFRRSSRMINMRTGAYSDTPLGSSSYGDMVPAGTLAGVSIADFPAPGSYYTFGFEWSQAKVRYFMLNQGVEVELFVVEGESYVPQRPAELLLNLWHSSTHWAGSGGSADFPAADANLWIDGVRIWNATP